MPPEESAIRSALRTVLTLFFFSGLIMAALGAFRFPFAVRFWRRLQWVAYVYVVVVVVSAVLRLTVW